MEYYSNKGMKIASIKKCIGGTNFSNQSQRVKTLLLLICDRIEELEKKPPNQEVANVCSCKNLTHLVKDGSRGLCLKCEKPYIPEQR